MADEYNAQLKPGAWRGRCGAPEIIDDEDSLQRKIEQLVTLIRGARHVVVHTGAGISTAAGIADFRGPNGVWTKDLEEKRRRAAEARKRKRKSHGTRADDLDAGDNNDDDAATTTSNDSASQPTATVQEASAAAPSSDSPACSTSSGTQPSSPSAPVRFENAIPTKTHMALVALHRASILKLVVTQNIDNLHLASGLPHSALAELHGNIFREMCEQVRPLGLGYNLAQEILVLIKRGPALRSRQCGTDYFRDYSIPSVGFKYTGRVCEEPGCTGRLRDCTLDWDDALPPQALKLAEVPHHTRARQRHASLCSHMCVRVSQEHTRRADVCICMGSSLQVRPASSLPLLVRRVHKPSGKTEPGKLVLINLQKTHRDKDAHLLIHAYVDRVMELLMHGLGLEIPDPFRLPLVPRTPPEWRYPPFPILADLQSKSKKRSTSSRPGAAAPNTTTHANSNPAKRRKAR